MSKITWNQEEERRARAGAPPFLRVQPIRRISHGRVEKCLARLFGKKIITEDGDLRLTCYWWRGACYVHKEEKCSESS